MPNYRLDANQYQSNQHTLRDRRYQPVKPGTSTSYDSGRLQPYPPTGQRQTNAYAVPRTFERPKKASKPVASYGLNQAAQSSYLKGLPAGKGKLLVVTVAILLIMWLSGYQLMPYHYVNHVIVSGTQYVSADAVRLASGIMPYDKVKAVYRHKQQIEKAIIGQNPTISSVDFRRRNWANFELDVNEHQVVGLQETNGKWMAILDNGVATDLETLNKLGLKVDTQTYPKLIQFDNQSGKLAQVAQALLALDPTILSQIETIAPNTQAQKPNAILLEMKDGNRVKGIIASFGKKMNYYNQIVQQLNGQIGEINFEVGAYFTPLNGSTNLIKINNN